MKAAVVLFKRQNVITYKPQSNIEILYQAKYPVQKCKVLNHEVLMGENFINILVQDLHPARNFRVSKVRADEGPLLIKGSLRNTNPL